MSSATVSKYLVSVSSSPSVPNREHALARLRINIPALLFYWVFRRADLYLAIKKEWVELLFKSAKVFAGYTGSRKGVTEGYEWAVETPIYLVILWNILQSLYVLNVAAEPSVNNSSLAASEDPSKNIAAAIARSTPKKLQSYPDTPESHPGFPRPSTSNSARLGQPRLNVYGGPQTPCKSSPGGHGLVHAKSMPAIAPGSGNSQNQAPESPHAPGQLVEQVKNRTLNLVNRYVPSTPSRLANSARSVLAGSTSTHGTSQQSAASQTPQGATASANSSAVSQGQESGPSTVRPTLRSSQSQPSTSTSVGASDPASYVSSPSIPLTEAIERSARRHRESSLRGSLRLSTPTRLKPGVPLSTSGTGSTTGGGRDVDRGDSSLEIGDELDPLAISTFVARKHPELGFYDLRGSTSSPLHPSSPTVISAMGATAGGLGLSDRLKSSAMGGVSHDPVVNDLRRSLLGIDATNDLE